MKLKYIFAGLMTIAALSMFAQPTVAAQDSSGTVCSSQRFLTFPAWYRGIVDGDCNIMSPADPQFGGFDGFIWRIGLNLVEIILNAVGYAAVAFIIYGGYKYMISTGSPEGMVGARKTILNASIGLIISIAAVAIINTVANTFQGGDATPPDCSQGGPC